MHMHSPNKPKKFKQTARKLMVAVFWARKRVPMVDFMQQGITVMPEVYCETLKRLYRAIQKKRLGMLTSGVMLLCDNACPHAAACTQALLEHLKLELFEHPPDSLDLTPGDYHLITYLKNWLGSQGFNNNGELMVDVKTWLNSQAVDFFDTGIQ
jgi:translation initiation factor 2 beta subunit (eIF-2beta)/eIF-5